jgi:hypothetical protein
MRNFEKEKNREELRKIVGKQMIIKDQGRNEVKYGNLSE